MSAIHSTFRTAESVSPGHPDKICDQISDALLDAYLASDNKARVAIEVCGGHGTVFLTGEVSSTVTVKPEAIVRRLAGDVTIVDTIARQSLEIARGVDTGGAGDQGIMVGYACSETDEMLPLEVVLARELNEYLYKKWPYDGKTQVTLRENEVVAIVASFQHASTADLTAAVKRWARRRGVRPTLHINPAGDWEKGGFDADAGLTGRKLVVDNYGPRIPIGGGCFSGKDATKVDRSAAYAARRIAVDYLRRFQAKEVYCYLAYAIGYDQPLEATVLVDGVEKQIEGYDLSPRGIIKSLKLTKPQFEQTARYGHFGHDFTWDN